MNAHQYNIGGSHLVDALQIGHSRGISALLRHLATLIYTALTKLIRDVTKKLSAPGNCEMAEEPSAVCVVNSMTSATSFLLPNIQTNEPRSGL